MHFCVLHTLCIDYFGTVNLCKQIFPNVVSLLLRFYRICYEELFDFELHPTTKLLFFV